MVSRWVAAAILRAVSAHELSPDALILECPFDRLLTTVQNRFAAMRLPVISRRSIAGVLGRSATGL
jgi:hypothetical protein